MRENGSGRPDSVGSLPDTTQLAPKNVKISRLTRQKKF